MSSDGSPAKPQSAVESAALAASGAPLAPGFRFHPTDEELVSYYLKRKVLSKPFAVDAISDVDLYRMEPWDLPGKSRIQSRDMEWYFFGSLDKKYSNKSKTNRATMQGYWKTTGKDRAVRRGTRTVGMKKTLVFHVGRAPKGERTNWVMHEYRLEDDELTKAEVAQDAYVVCRIFQKNGPGPQNGAQYGAPFVEAEWEDDDKVMLGWEHGGGNILMGSGDHERPEQEDKHVDIQNENTAHQIASSDEHNIIVSSVELNSSHVQVPRNDVISGQNEVVYLPELDDDLDAFLINDTFGLLGSQSPLDDYLELNDLAKPLDVEEYGLHQTSVIQNEQAFMGVFDHDNIMGGLHDVEDHFNFGEDDVQFPKQDGPAFVEDNYYQDTDEIFNKIADDQADDSMLYFDAGDLYPGIQRDGFVQMTDFLDPMPSAFPASDPLEDIGAYFDATDDTVQKSSVDEFLDLSTPDSGNIWDEGDALQPDVQSSQLPIANCVSGASSSGLSSSRGKQIAQTSYFPKNPDLYGNVTDKSIKGRLISMLGSISSPPALAAEPKALGLNPAAQTSSSIHITAGMIHINGLRVNGNGHPWSGEKDEDLGFRLSYDTARADIRSNSSGFAHVGKMHCSSVSVAVRSGYCLSFLTVLFFAVFLKMGVIYLCQVK